jgi:hypothetical protein
LHKTIPLRTGALRMTAGRESVHHANSPGISVTYKAKPGKAKPGKAKHGAVFLALRLYTALWRGLRDFSPIPQRPVSRNVHPL